MRGTVGLGAAAIAALVICAPTVRGQQNRLPGAVYDFEKKGEKLGPAPKRDLAGTWEPANGADGGIQGKGALAMESCKRDASGKYAVDPNAPKYDTGYATPDCLKPNVDLKIPNTGSTVSWRSL